ncbi:secreted protein [Colletotrichum tofieldiae]|nr:secreted protein [Colletotrichum tofieldiae]
MVRFTSVLLALATAASALRVKSVSHSGPACPQDAKVTWSGDLDDLTITLSDFSETLAAGQMTSCQVHLLVDGGDAGRALVLQDVVVRGGLYLSSNAKVDFYTTAYWSEAASDTVTKSTSTSSGSGAVARNVAVAQRVNTASTCVGSGGYVGILNVTFRIISQAGSRVVFGKEHKDGGTSPVTEALTFKWQGC